MRTNVPGRVENTPLPPYRALQPVFEVISNAIDAVHDLNGEGGRIQIIVTRRDEPQLISGGAPIASICITDTGIGFSDERFDAFNEADTPYKRDRGGKGMGRFLWLKVFEYATIDSAYYENGAHYRRIFRFVNMDEGIEDHQLQKAVETNGISSGTSVTLFHPLPVYSTHLPRSLKTLATRITEHFLPTFVSLCPRITIRDDEEEIDLNALFNEEFAHQSAVVDFQVDGNALTIRHIMNPGMGDYKGHHVHFCAAQRSVEMIRLEQLDPRFPKSKIINRSTNVAFYYVGLVSGATLTRAATPDRGELDLPDESIPGLSLSRNALRTATAAAIHDFLGEHLEPLRRSQLDLIHQLAVKEPQYHILEKYHREALAAIPPDVTDEQELDAYLRTIEFKERSKLRARAADLSSKPVQTAEDLAEYREAYLRYIEQENQLGQASLAQYVTHRRVILDLLAKFLGINADGKYELEELIHKIICPMRITSDEPEFSSHNLWLVDERLEYHSFMASDKELRSLAISASKDQQRPDLVIFNRQLAFRDAISSIVVVEFKRPQRMGYSDSDNPVDDVSEYIQRIRAGGVKDKNGRQIDLPESTPFFGFAICDRTTSLKDLAARRGWHDTPDQQGYYFYNEKLRALIHVISYDKMLEDARQRNRVLFEKLHLPSL